MSIARGLRRLWRNEISTLLTQAGSHEALFQREINGHPPGGPCRPKRRTTSAARSCRSWASATTGTR